MNLSASQHYSQFYRGTHGVLLVVVAFSVGQALLVLPITYLVRYAFDTVIPSGAVSILVLVGILSLFLNLANSGVTLWTRHLTLTITKKAVRDYRHELLNRMYLFPRAYYDEADLSKLQTTIVEDTQQLDVMSNAVVALFIPSFFASLVVCIVLVFLNAFLFLVIISVIPLLLLASRVMGRSASRRVNRYQRAFEAFNKGIAFVLQRMDLTRVQTAEQFEVARQRQNIDGLQVTSRSMAWFNAAYGLVQGAIVTVSGALILIVGGAGVARGVMTLGELLSFQVGVGLLSGSLNTMFSSIPPVISGNESLSTLAKVWQAQMALPYSGWKRITFSGKITLVGVHFRYSDRPILEDAHLAIYPGSTVALVGPNGAGKSTVAHLILGHYRPQSGGLCADGHPYEELDLMDLRRSIGVVMQEPLLFAGTILENITYGCPDATYEQVARAATLATAHEFIQRLPNGYGTFIGENGVLLSGGERQRIALARSFLRRPKLLILDEPTNHLDAEAVIALLRNLAHMENSPSILIISHDLNVARGCEHAYALQEGHAFPMKSGNLKYPADSLPN
jgi:ATP-binding cassette subfamily B protein